MSDPITTSLLEITSDGPFAGAIQFDSPAGGTLTIRGPSGTASLSLTLPATMPNTGDYLRVNGGGQLYWDAGCSGCGGTSTGGITDPGSNGLLVRTDVNTYVTRSIVPGVGSPITIINGDGVAGNILLGLMPGDTTGQVLTWDQDASPPHWKAAAGGGVSAGGGGTPNVLTRWLTGTTLQNSALSQDPTGNTVSASGSFVVAGTLKANTFLQFSPFTAPPTGPPGLATIYYQGGTTPLWVASSSAPDPAQWRPINAIMFGSAGGAFGPANRILVGRTGGIVGDGGGVGGGAGFTGPFDGEIYLTPGTASGQVMFWNGAAWGPGGGSSGVGSDINLGVTQGFINVIPIWTGTNSLGNSLIRQEGAAPITYVRIDTDLYVSNGYVRTDKYLDLTNTVLPPTGGNGTARIAYGTSSNPNAILASINGQPWAPLNAITMKASGGPLAGQQTTASTWTVVAPLQPSAGFSGEGVLSLIPGNANGDVLTFVIPAGQTPSTGSWQARTPGTTTSGGVTASGATPPFIPLFTGTNTISNSTLSQTTTGDLTTNGALSAGKWLQSGTNGYVGFKAFGLPGGPSNPSNQVLSNVGEARIVFYSGQLQVSTNGNPYAPIAGGSLPATGATNTVPLWTSTSTLGTSSLTRDPGGWVYVALGMSLAQKVRTAQWMEFAPVSGQSYGAAVVGGQAAIFYNQANLRLEYTVNGSAPAPLISPGAVYSGTPGYIPILGTAGNLTLAGSTFSQDTTNGRLTFGDFPVNNGSWTLWLRAIQNNVDGLLVILPGAVGSSGNGIALARSIGDTTFLVSAEGNLSIINRIRYVWPAGNPGFNQVLKCTAINIVGGVQINTLSWA